MGVLIDNQQGKCALLKKKIRKKAQAILDALGSPEAELSILIVGDPEIEELNRRYLNRPGPTNVIAFPMKEGGFPEISPQLLGDVVISIQTAQQEAKRAGISMETRFEQLLVHGILHLFGFEHEKNENEARKMEAKSMELLKLIEKI
jgi:probable rRNA maturation factor